MKTRTSLGLLVAAGLHVTSAFANRTERLVVTLETPDELMPEIFCIIGEQKCNNDRCHSLADLAAVMVAGGHDITFTAKPEALAVADVPLREAMNALSRPKGDTCQQCRPRLRRVQYMGGSPIPKGYIACTRNSRTTNSDRVALAYLRFNRTNAPAPLKSIDLLGNQVTVEFLNNVDTDDYQFLLSLGGDYLPDTTGLGTKERMTLRLTPRCTASVVEIPARVTIVEHEDPDFKLDNVSIDGCVEKTLNSTTIWLPYRLPEAVSKLQISFHSGFQSLLDTYESSWTEHLPPRLLKIQRRRVEFSWRKDCLVGTLPWTGDLNWSQSCPKATLPIIGANCTVFDSNDRCEYQCEALSTMPAFDLPTRVRFDRLGGERDSEVRTAFSWEDTLVYSGQELTSFVAPNDRKVIVEFPTPDEWRSHFGNEIDSVELQTDLGAEQRIPIGDSPPAWAAVPAPNATCSSRFAIDVIGTRSFSRTSQNREANGNIVLRTPKAYRNLFHWVFMFGGGILSPRNERVYDTERRLEPFGSIGAGIQLYYARPFSGAFELNLIYEPTLTGYGAIQLKPQRSEGIITVPYHRGIMEIAGTIWGRKRVWEAGLFSGGGLGGPVHGFVEKVGTIRWFALFGALGRLRLFSKQGWVEADIGLRWGEHHEFFGTDANGRLIKDTFHGEPALTERPLWQLYGGLRWRLILR